MPDEQLIDVNYQKGFNEGYIITKHLPELSDSLALVKGDHSRMEGFRDGRKEFVLEKIKENTPQSTNTTPEKSLPKEPVKQPSKDKEPDR